jgi:hypothetical protein
MQGFSIMRNAITFLCALLITAGVQTARADTTWVATGEISGVWTADGNPYMISAGNVEIADEDSLFISEGVVIRFTGGYVFRVYGYLQAIGTEQDSIYFTSDPVANPTGWRGLRFDGSEPGCELSYCVIERGRATGTFDLRYGGGMECRASSPSIMDCTIRNNFANLDGGGAYLRESSSPRFERCAFNNNTSNTGGGGILVRAQSNPLLKSCIFSGNYSPLGGGINAGTSSDIVLTDCIFDSNSANLGGGLCANSISATPLLTNCTFINNSADSSGAGAYLKSTDGTIRHCVFYGNESEDAGGIFIDGASADIYSTIIASSSQGAGIRFFNAGGSSISGCDIFGNSGGELTGDIPEGIGILARLSLNYDSCDVFSNIFLDPQFIDPQSGDFHLAEESPCIAAGISGLILPDDADGISRPQPLMTLPDQGIYENDGGSPMQICGSLSGTLSRGIYAATCDLVVEDGANLVIERGSSILFAGDFGFEVNGRLSVEGQDGQPVVFSTYFPDSAVLWGGIQFIDVDEGLLNFAVIENAHIDSQATRTHGGGIYLENSSISIIGCTIRNNEALLANSEGGGIYCGAGSYTRIIQCIIDSNRATLKGGGVSVAAESQTFMEECSIMENESGLFGGGVYLHQSASELSKCIISGNQTSGRGGGVYSWLSPVDIYKCVIANNASGDKGGGLYVNGESPLLRNCTIYGNSAPNGGGGLLLYQTSAQIKNSIVALSSGSGIEFVLNNALSQIEYSNVFGNTPQNYIGLLNGPIDLSFIADENFNGDPCDVYRNISSDPGFADSAASDYGLTEVSVCINAGDPNGAFDPDSSIADQGAEYFPLEYLPSTPFILLAPLNGAGVDEDNIQLAWEFSFDAGTTEPVPLYRTEVSTDSLFRYGVFAQTVSDVIAYYDGLADSTTYWWRVLAIGSNGIARSSSNRWSMYTVVPQPPSPFVLLSPPDLDTMSIYEPRLFCWENSIDPDGGDFVVFSLKIASAETLLVFTDLTDTCLNIVPAILGLHHQGDAEWWVEASSNHPDTMIECEERFDLFLRDPNHAVETRGGLPDQWALHPNFPNPFNATTTIAFDVPVESNARLVIMNVLGQEVTELVSGRVQPGIHQVRWEANDLPSGVYLAVLQTNNQRWIRKLMLLK